MKNQFNRSSPKDQARLLAAFIAAEQSRLFEATALKIMILDHSLRRIRTFIPGPPPL